MNHEKTFAAIEKFKDIELELHRLKNALELANKALDAQPAQEPVQVSPLEFVTMILEKEHLIGNPIIWAQWPNKEKNT